MAGNFFSRKNATSKSYFDNLQIKWKLIIAFVFFILMLIATSSVSYWKIRNVNNSLHQFIIKVSPKLDAISHLESNLNGSVVAVISFSTGHLPSVKQQYLMVKNLNRLSSQLKLQLPKPF